MIEMSVPKGPPSRQAELLKATLAVYAAENEVDAAATLFARASRANLGSARLMLAVAENRLITAQAARKGVIARIQRDEAEAAGRRWLKAVGGKPRHLKVVPR